jgi:predicted TIM-barrel fold metal-dependent hydrolase
MKYFDSLTHVTADGRWGVGRHDHDASEARLVRELDSAGAHRACLVALAGIADNETTLDVAVRNPDRFVAIGSIDPTAVRDPAVAVGDLAAAGFSGVKLHPRLHSYDPLDERCLAAIDAAGSCDLTIFLDTLFRQQGRATRHPVDVVDELLVGNTRCRFVLLHGTGPTVLELFELGRMHDHALIDLSFTLLRYAGSSVDDDVGFLCEQLDQRLCIGSDFPEYSPGEAVAQFDRLTSHVATEKRENVLWRNLERWFPTHAPLS